ncbi:MAG: PAS domain-containing protein [Thermodesulfobacteriota bacterium]|nr:PAS domain-containing protein [Thermodesulfobacteriota bacterium]
MKEENESTMEVNDGASPAIDAERQLLAAEVNLLYENAPTGLVATLVNSIILTFVLWGVTSPTFLVIWFACLFLLTAARYVLVLRYRNASGIHLDPAKWGHWFTMGAVFSGIIWGSAGVFLFPVASVAHQAFIAFVLGGMVAGAVGVFSVIKRVFFVFALPAMLPINVQFFMQGTDVHFAMGLMILLFTVLMVGTSRRMHTATVSSLKLGFENTNLIERLAGEKERIEGLNEDLTSEIAQRRQAQEALEKSHQELEQRVLERTAKLATANERLEKEVKDRRRAEEALRVSELQYRELVENLNDVIFSIDAKGVVTYISPVIESMMGYKPPEIMGRSFTEFMHPEDLPRMMKQFQKVLSGHTEPSEYRLMAASGEARWIRSSSRPVFEGNRVAGLRGVMTDVTDQKRIEEAGRETEEKYRLVSKNIPVVVYSALPDASSTTLFMSGRIKDLTGYSGEDFIESPGLFNNMFHPDDRDHVREKIEEHRRKKTHLDAEYRIITKDRVTKWVKDRATPILDENEEIVRIDGFMEDITERKQLEDQLRHAHKMEAIGTLAGGIAHDYNNLLSVILGNIAMAKEDLKPEHDIYPFLNEAETASFKARELTHRLITFSRGGAPIREKASIMELLRESADLALAGSGVTCDFAMPSDLWAVEYDEAQMQQVINNLMTNAYEATPEGGTVRLTAENVVAGGEEEKALPLPDGEYVKISVSDQGVGIPEEQLSVIFDPYFSTKERGEQKGMGLGLATAYSIVKKHGGHMAVESQVGVGTTFDVHLPASQERLPERVGAMVAIGHRELPARRVLVMEDEDTLRNLCGQMLERLGYEVALAKNGEETIEEYRNAMDSGEGFSAVILDLSVRGGMGGKEALRKLQKIAPDVKAIVSSGYHDDPVMTEWQEHGFKGVIFKPYLKEDLKVALRKALGQGDA